MSLRFSPEDAERLGIITQEEATQIRKGMRQSARPNSRGSSRPSGNAGRRNVDPQQILFQALCARLPGYTLPESLRLAEEIGSSWDVAASLNNLTAVQRHLGNRRHEAERPEYRGNDAFRGQPQLAGRGLPWWIIGISIVAAKCDPRRGECGVQF